MLTPGRRLLVAWAVCVLALVSIGTAFGTHNAELVVASTSHVRPGGGETVFIAVGPRQSDEASGLITLYSPLGYGVTLGQPAGRELGDLAVTVQPRPSFGASQRFSGTVRAADPAAHVGNTCSPGWHDAVWVLEESPPLYEPPIPLTVFVDRVTGGPESAFASARMRICPPSPYERPLPPDTPERGVSLLDLSFSVASVFWKPRMPGSYAWNAVSVPYIPGTATLNLANAAQSTSFVRLPVLLTVKAKRQRRGKRRYALATACLRENGHARRGAGVVILAAPTGDRWRRVAAGFTNTRGCLTARIRVGAKVVFVRARLARTPMDFDRDPPIESPWGVWPVGRPRASGCEPAIVPRCSKASFAPAFGVRSRNTVRVPR